MKKYVYVLFLMSILCSCSTWRKGLTSEPGLEGCTHNLMLDFKNTAKLYHQGDVFEITNQIYNYKSQEGTITLIIWLHDYAMCIEPDEGPGTKPKLMNLMDYKEDEGKLFLITDTAAVHTIITQDYYDVLKKYDLLKHLWFLESQIPIYGHEGDGDIMILYSFCPDNPKRYKRSGEFHHFTRESRRRSKRPLKVKCK
jgi:hypothetical protein